MFKIAFVIVPALVAAAVVLVGEPGLAPEGAEPEIHCADMVENPGCVVEAAKCAASTVVYGRPC